MVIQRLTWAGLRISASNEHGQTSTLYLDPLFEVPPRFAPFLPGPAPYVLPAGPATAVLLTHLHEDHYGPASVRRVAQADARIFCPAESAQEVAHDGFRATGLKVWERSTVGPFTVTALPAVDGTGDPQVSWLVEADGVRIIHCGDTLWHGYWWSIAERIGSLAAAFLPINGPLINFPWLQPASGVAAAMTPVQAAAAAQVLRAELTVPIHYDIFHLPPIYTEESGAAETFLREAAERGVATHVLEPGDTLDLPFTFSPNFPEESS